MKKTVETRVQMHLSPEEAEKLAEMFDGFASHVGDSPEWKQHKQDIAQLIVVGEELLRQARNDTGLAGALVDLLEEKIQGYRDELRAAERMEMAFRSTSVGIAESFRNLAAALKEERE